MKTKYFFLAGLIVLAGLGILPAQTSVQTVTNVISVLVTNIVTITNVVIISVPSTPPAPAIAVMPAWQSSVSAGLTLTRGNSQTLLFSLDFLSEKKLPDNEYALGAAMAYGTQNSQENANSYKGFAQWNHLFNERFYGYARAEGLRDHVADLDYRLTIGPGLGYYLVKTTNTFLASEAGLGFETQRVGTRNETFMTVRLAERYEHKFNDRARLWQKAEIIPQVDQFDNYVVNFEIGAEAAFSKTLTLKTYLDDTYQNRPAAGRKKNDAKIVAAVAYKF